MKKFIIILIVIIIVAVGGYYLFHNSGNTPATNDTATTTSATSTQTQMGTSTVSIGKSVQGRDIMAYHYGTGTKELVFIGGIHGGYEWNTSLLSYQLMDYLAANPTVIPSNIKVTIIPVMNPDGLKKVTGTDSRFTASDIAAGTDTVPGRFNGNNVDLGRNFDCDWQTSGVWQNKTVSGGTSAFSEPESQAIENYVNASKPVAIVTYYSSAPGVFSSSCHNGVSTETKALTQKYAAAAGYPAYETFDFYQLTGDMVNWFAKQNIPAISVLLTNHTGTDWVKNQAGVQALFTYYTK